MPIQRAHSVTKPFRYPFTLPIAQNCHDSRQGKGFSTDWTKKSNNSISRKIIEDVYVDNVISGTNSVGEAVELYNVSKTLFCGATMNLRDWLSNNSEVMKVMKEIPLDDRCSRENMTVLGLNWSIQNDTLTINSQLKDDLKISKRTVLQEIASIYDSLGLYSPVTLRGKLFLQDLWNQKLSWDDHLSEENKSAWNVIKADLKQLATSQFPRYIGLEKTDKSYNQILVFCDSSKNAYAAAVYLLQNNEKHRTVNLFFSKTRLVPNKQITIPRLELLADLIGARCLIFVEKELKLEISQKHMWIDSQCVLNWINSQKPLRIFVKNRVKEIKEDKSIQYHYISTKENPEDIACRGKSTSELQGDSL